jgi:serine/threonine protein kinase
VGSALDAAHARGLVHRDVKPGNILLGATSEGGFHAYLTDFGITKDSSEQTVGLTHTGQWVGTVDYVSPEQLSGQPIDARSVVYSLGCVLYQALAGHAPYQGADVHKVYAHVHEPPPSLQDGAPDLAPAFDPVIQRAMAKDPAQRYPSAGDLGRAGQAAARGELNTVPERTVAAGEAATGIAPTAVAPTEMAATTPLYERAAPAAHEAPTPVPPPAAAPPGRRSRRRLWIGLTAAAVLLVAAVAALAVVALTGNDKSGGSSASSGSSSSGKGSSSSGGSSSGGSSQGSSADRTFVSKTDDLLARSKPSYDEINDVFRRMQDVANGQSDAIEPDEAKSKLSEVITNRESLKSQAAALPASSGKATESRSDLVAAFEASLVNDKAIQSCIETGQATGTGQLFSDCLQSTSSSSDAATEAKDTFKASYNRLRESLGLADVNPTF